MLRPSPVTYTVTFDSDGGSDVPSQTVNNGSKATSNSYDNDAEITATYDTQLNSANKSLYQYLYSYTIPNSLITLLDTQDVYLTSNLEKG